MSRRMHLKLFVKAAPWMHRVFAVVVTERAVDARAPVVLENIAKTMRSIASVRRRMCGGECGGDG